MLGNKQGKYNKDMSLSKKALREERKTRKQEKRRMARRAEVISYIKKKIPIAILIVVGIVWCIVDLHINRPIIDEKDTYSYVGTCVEIEKKSNKSIVSYGRDVDWIEISFEDGYSSKWGLEQFSDSELESMRGSTLSLLMAKHEDGDFLVGITDENGYVYYSLDEYNAEMRAYRLTVIAFICVPIVLLYLMYFGVNFPRRY